MLCPNCGYMMSAFDKDCPRCKALARSPQLGKTVQLPPRDDAARYHADKCPRCGASLVPGLQLCTTCGTKFPALIAAPNPPPAVAPTQYMISSQPALPDQQAAHPQVVIYNNAAPPQQVPPQYPYQYQDGEFIKMPAGQHNVAMAVVIALFLNGGGQFVNKQTGKGWVILLLAVLLGSATYGIGWLVVSIFGLADAICIAQKLNRGEAVRKWQWF